MLQEHSFQNRHSGKFSESFEIQHVLYKQEMRLPHARMGHSPVWATPSNDSRVFRNKEEEIVGEAVFSVLIMSKDFSKMFLFR